MTDFPQAQNWLGIREFWDIFSGFSPAVSPLPLPLPASLALGLDRYFGRLASHTVEEVREGDISLLCMHCRNANGSVKEDVCETHAGVIAGTIRAVAGRTADVTYSPDLNDGCCRIKIALHKLSP